MRNGFTDSVEDSSIVFGDEMVPARVLRMFVRMGTRETGFSVLKIEGVEAIRIYLGK